MTTSNMWLKSIVRYPLDIRRARGMLAAQAKTRQPDHRGRAIVLDLATPHLHFDCARHLVCIARHASIIGSPVTLRCSGVLLGGIARKLYGRQLLTAPNVRWVPPGTRLPNDALVLRDSPQMDQEVRGSQDHYRMMVGRDVVPATPVMPYPMHHDSIEHAQNLDLVRLREASDRHGVFFAGRQKAAYAKAVIESNFGIMSRMRFLRTLQDRLGSRITKDLDRRDPQKPIVLLDTDEKSIEATDWLPTLARFNFFLCPPGASQPICHNAIEAMCVGTIPVLEYHDRFWPRLVDGVNAVCFQGEHGLIDAINRIAAMNPQQIDQLRGGVVDHYQQHLRGETFLAELRDSKNGSIDGMISMPFHDQNFYDGQPMQSNTSRVA